MFSVVVSTSAAARLSAAREFLSTRPSGSLTLIVGAARGAADDLARSVARQRGATFGLERFSLVELAALSLSAARAERYAPATAAAMEAVAARVVFDATADHTLDYFAPVAGTPGFPRALARTLHELRLAGVAAGGLGSGGRAERDLQGLLARVEAEIARAGIDDRAALFRAAADVWTHGASPWPAVPFVLLDVAMDSRAEQAFVAAIAGQAPGVATVPDGDQRALDALLRMGASRVAVADDAAPGSDLASLRRFIFTNEVPRPRTPARDVLLMSAPGEGREAVEIVRSVLDEAARGVPFDEMAVFLRVPQQYLGLLEHACARAQVPVYFERGTRRPDPAGRAFVALLSCAVEGLSAKRFDEYLSLGQVPRLTPAEARARTAETIVPADDAFVLPFDLASLPDQPESANPDDNAPDSDEEAIVAGTLRAPWKWEELIVESAVVGGRTREEGKARWRRRLKGLQADFELRREELRRDEPDSPLIARLDKDLQNLLHLRSFALPVIDRMADWPDAAAWAEWIARFSDLATVALARPRRVLQVLAELRPMGAIGPVTIEQARDVLHERLVTLDWDPPARRYGRLFVGTAHQARGRSFSVVFVPGLAERVVPQRPREDPLLLDDRRARVEPDLLQQEDRGAAERLLLKVAIGTARDRLYLSYPRMDIAETRARVPSFYALDVMRAITGHVPDHRQLAAAAADEVGASLAWPAPRDPDAAIDDLEHDLAVLRPLLDARDTAAVKGQAHYLLGLNESLGRSIRARWRRDQKAWSGADGFVASSPGGAAAIARHRLDQREYSLSALQRFATCPYQFFLASIHRLHAWEEPTPLLRMDPLTRGSLFHKAQAEFYRRLEAEGRLPIRAADVPALSRTLDLTLEAVAREYEDLLMPAIPRVWADEIEEIRRDLGIWVEHAARESPWTPKYFEFSFGLNDDGRDPRSLEEPITVGGRFRLRGSVDLIEEHRESGQLRVTDHKTGKNRSKEGLIVGGGAVLQPVLYSVAIEEGLSRPVASGRLYYCTTAGGFAEHAITIDDYSRSQGLQVLEIVDRAVAEGCFVTAPAERACTWCDFRPVCGPREEERAQTKQRDRLADLLALRSMR